MDLGGWNLAVIYILLPAFLVIVLLWVLLRNRSSRRSMDETEQGTRDLYREEEKARRDGDDGRP